WRAPARCHKRRPAPGLPPALLPRSGCARYGRSQPALFAGCLTRSTGRLGNDGVHDASRIQRSSSISLSPSPERSYTVPHDSQALSPESASLSPHRHIQPIRRAGIPTTRANGATSFVTTAPAPTNAYSPSVNPHTTVAFAPIVAPRLTRVRWYSCLRETALRGFSTFVNTMLGPQNTSSSSSTPS